MQLFDMTISDRLGIPPWWHPHVSSSHSKEVELEISFNIKKISTAKLRASWLKLKLKTESFLIIFFFP